MLFGDERIPTQNVFYLALRKIVFLTCPIDNLIAVIPTIFFILETAVEHEKAV